MRDRTAAKDQICIVGLGYVGSSLAAVLAERGLDVTGVDVDAKLVDEVNTGECPIEEDVITDRFETAVAAGQISATTDYNAVADQTTILVTVGTPLAEANPDTSAVEAAAESIAPHLKHDDLVIFRSTLPAGSTEDSLRPILEEGSGLTAGTDFSLGFSPERMAEGTAYDDLTEHPIVVGGYTEACRERIKLFWESIGNDTVSVSSPTTAEFTKLADNWWIDLNIALANEIALLAEELGVDAMEVIHAANTLPKGKHNVNILFPGAGVGGSCLIKDPWFVANLGDRHGLDLQTPRVSRKVNDRMPNHVVDLVEETTGDLGDTTVAVLGYAFKAGTDDTRNTPAREIVDLLREAGATVCVTDPYVPAETIESETGITPTRLPEALDGADAVAVVTGHEQYQSLSVEALESYIGTGSFAVVDGRFAFDPAAFTDSAATYRGVGRGENNE